MTELKANGTCDFCGEACNADMPGAKAYDCEDFPMALTGTMSYGAWGACPSCAALIDSENWDALETHDRDSAPPLRLFGGNHVAQIAADAYATDSTVPTTSTRRAHRSDNREDAVPR